MKILVTGAGGFIGAHLTALLLENGTRVIALDNYNDYYSPRYKLLRFSQIVEKVNNKRLSVIHTDLCDAVELNKLFASEKPEVIIHLAGQAGVRLPSEENYKYVDSNIVAFGNVLNLSLKWKAHVFMYASSSSVYGNSSEFPLQERSLNLRPVSFYGATKLVNEIWARSMSHNSDMRILGMRFFSVYGPWGRPDMAYFKIIKSLYSGNPFRMYGDGSHVRDMTHVLDVVKSIELLSKFMCLNDVHTPTIVNIGGGRPHSLLELISALEYCSGKKLKINRMPASDLDVFRTEASFEKLYSMIKFSPSIGLMEGAESLVDWAIKPEVINNLSEWSPL